jgi:hypothetical protein
LVIERIEVFAKHYQHTDTEAVVEEMMAVDSWEVHKAEARMEIPR